MKTKWLKIFAVCALLCAFSAIGAFAANGLTGDVDGNGDINVHDAIACIKGIAEQTANEACDVNGDGSIDVLDAMAIVQIVVKQGESGFSVLPKVTADPANGYDRISGVALSVGKLYYYYTNVAKPPEMDGFLAAYTAAPGGCKGQLSVQTPVFEDSLAVGSSVASFRYVVVMFEDSNGGWYRPTVLVREPASIGTGFAVAPSSILSSGSNVCLKFKAAAPCLVSYYLAESSVIHDFGASYAAASVRGRETAGSSETIVILGEHDVLALSPYTHVIVRAQSFDGTVVYQPIAVALAKITGVPGYEEF